MLTDQNELYHVDIKCLACEFREENLDGQSICGVVNIDLDESDFSEFGVPYYCLKEC